ncbi:MAG: 5'-nucleotidase, partial [Myxococcota bacterium]
RRDACTDECRAARRDCASIPAPVDGAMTELLDPYVQKLYLANNLNKAFAVATDRIDRFGQSGEDSPLGNLVADSMRFRNRIEAQFSMTNSLGIRINMEQGLVSIEEMFNIFPFENTLTTVYLSGVEVQELFDYVTERSSERGCQTQAQISGATFTMDCAQAIRNQTGPACETNAECEATDFAKLGEEPYVQCRSGRCYKHPSRDIIIEGKGVIPTESYKVAVNDFIGRGGSGFEVLRRNTTKIDTTLSLRDALIDYMRTSPDDGGPGRVCGSPYLVPPIHRPKKPLVVRTKADNPGTNCNTRPAGCSATTGTFIDCTETDTTFEFYCLPNDFKTCDDLANAVSQPIDVLTRPADTNDGPSCMTGTAKSCPGTLHCCENKLGDTIESDFYCIIPYCIDPPVTGRITRIVQ